MFEHHRRLRAEETLSGARWQVPEVWEESVFRLLPNFTHLVEDFMVSTHYTVASDVFSSHGKWLFLH